MVEDDFFEEFEASKDELVEQYHTGELDKNERVWFERTLSRLHRRPAEIQLAVALDSVRRPQLSQSQWTPGVASGSLLISGDNPGPWLQQLPHDDCDRGVHLDV